MIFDGNIFWLGLGNPRHIATKSQFCMVVVLVSKSWNWVSPLVETKSHLRLKISFAGSPNGHDNDYDIVD